MTTGACGGGCDCDCAPDSYCRDWVGRLLLSSPLFLLVLFVLSHRVNTMVLYDIVVMLEYFQELIYSDKVFENKVLGKVSCAAFSETLKDCKQTHRMSRVMVDPCVELRQVTDHCYRSKDVNEVNQWLDSQFKEAFMLFKFLEDRQSALPEKISKNSWAVFTNKHNLNKYQQEMRKEGN